MVHKAPQPYAHHLERALRDRPEVLEAYLFGSHARGSARADSDLDVAVYVDRQLSEKLPEGPFGYAAELATILSAAIRKDRIDVLLLNEAPPLLYHRVLRDGVRLLSRDLRATTLREGQALSRYCDYLPQLRKIQEAHSRRIARGGFGR
jgi:predicted nucleotidyltransferase